MAKHHNPRIVTSNLLLNLDFRNPKRFSSSLGTNLVQDQNYNAATWGVYFTNRTSGIDSPDGNNTAVRISTIVRSGTYTLTSNVVTVTIAGHGLSGGNHYFDFTSGTGIDGLYTITVVNADTFTFPVTAVNGSGNVLMYVRQGLRVGFTAFTPNGTDTYTASFWVRLIYSSFLLSSTAVCDLSDGSPSVDYTSQLIQNQWVQIVVNGIPSASSKSFFDLFSDCFGDITMDFWGLKIENQTANNTTMPLMDTIGGYTASLARPQYSSLSDSVVTFSRSASTPKWGGNINLNATNSLTSGNFIYGNHTWEIWFKINDINPALYDGTEGMSVLSVYSGYHLGFMYNQSQMTYYMWDNVGPTSVNACTWTVAAQGAQINQGSWYQIVVTRSGNTFTPYLNGAQLGVGSTRAYTALPSVSNTIHLGSAGNLAPGIGSYVYYSKNSIANMKMYNRALSADEIAQNFNALRGRFNL